MAVTPVQRLKVDMFSLKIMIVGMFAGAVGSIISFFVLNVWWSLVIGIVLLFGGFLQISQYIEKYQMLQSFKDMEDFEKIHGRKDDIY